MREIEFRAWLKNSKKMVEIEAIHFIGEQIAYDEIEYGYEYRYTDKDPFHYTQWVDFEEIELMQYAGVEDKNGVKIFEGDIVRCDDEICTIVWDEPYVLYAVSSKENGNDSLGNFEPKDLEVIGNIYENKELLG